MRFGFGVLLAAVLTLVGPTVARAAADEEDGILEGELLQVDSAAGNLLVAEAGSGQAIVIGLHQTAIFLQGEQPIGLGRIPIRSDVRVLYQVHQGRRIADRIDVFPHAVPDLEWSPRQPKFRAQHFRGGDGPVLRRTGARTEPTPGAAAPPTCPRGMQPIAPFSSASSPGTVLSGGGTAVGSSHSSSVPGDPRQPAQPQGNCVPVEGRPSPSVLP